MNKIILVVLISVLMACGKDDSKSSSSSASGDLSILLESSQLALTAAQTLTSCSASGTSGRCTTPLAVTGSFSAAQLGNSSGGRPVRLLGGGTSSGLANIFKHADFDLEATPEIPGEDNIQDGSSGQSYNYMAIQAQQIEFAFQATTASKIYRIKTFFVNNKPSTETVFADSSCRVASALTEADSLGILLEGVDAKAGDIMVCVKDSLDEACEPTDYSWIDSSGALVATRPSSPKAQSGSGLIKASSCPSDGANWGYTDFNIALSSAQSITASFGEGGVKTYVSGDKKGTKLTFTLDINLENSLFIPDAAGISDLGTVSEAAVLNNLHQIMLKPQYVRKSSGSSSSSDLSSMLQATPTLLLE